MKHMSVATKLLASYVLLAVVVAILSIALVLPAELDLMETSLEQSLSRMVYVLAHDREIIDGLSAGELSTPLRDRLDGILRHSDESIDFIVVADTHSIRLYHPERNVIGKKFIGGDEVDALKGKDAYLTVRQGRPDLQKRAFHSVRDDNGTIIGFVMASTSMDRIVARRTRIMLGALGVFGILLLAGALLSWGIARNVRRILLGYDPTTFAQMYLQREELLDSLDEGIVVVNQEYQVIYRNLSAKEYVNASAVQETSPIYPSIRTSFHSGDPVPWFMAEFGNKSFLANIVPLHPLGNLDAVMVILRNRTEFVRMTEQLTGMNHIIDALRANTHEYRNKLHVLYGLLQLNETKEAMSLISREASETNAQSILRLIRDKTVAALLLGKANRAHELGIQFRLRPNSSLPEEKAPLSTQELVTVLGNLLENSFEAIGSQEQARQVELFLFSDGRELSITVDDTGCGMEEDAIRRITEGQYTTKGAGHGYGLRLVQEIVERHGGFLQIDSEPGTGTSIAIDVKTTAIDAKENASKQKEVPDDPNSNR